MPEKHVAMIECKVIPLLEINLNLDLIAANFFKGYQRWIYCCRRLHEYPALHLWRQLPLKALEFAHGLIFLLPYKVSGYRAPGVFYLKHLCCCMGS